MWVIKLGGSLQDSEHLQPWLNNIVKHGVGRLVLAPGGGRFADAVREEQKARGFDDREAHSRAVKAMEQFAGLLREYAPELVPVQSRAEILDAVENNQLPIWLPSAIVIDNPALPASWSVTSDSLALWLARQLEAAGLMLVKSVAVDELKPLDDLAAAGVIDAFFPELFQRQPVNLAWFAAGDYEMLPGLLEYGVPRTACTSI